MKSACLIVVLLFYQSVSYLPFCVGGCSVRLGGVSAVGKVQLDEPVKCVNLCWMVYLDLGFFCIKTRAAALGKFGLGNSHFDEHGLDSWESLHPPEWWKQHAFDRTGNLWGSPHGKTHYLDRLLVGNKLIIDLHVTWDILFTHKMCFFFFLDP